VLHIPNELFPRGFSPKFCVLILVLPPQLHVQLLTYMPLTVLGDEHETQSSLLSNLSYT